MENQTPRWLQEYQQPYVEQKNLHCARQHLHQDNIPSVGFVLCRLNKSLKLEVLLDLRSHNVWHGDTWGFIGGHANHIDEEPMAVALRESYEEYGITPDQVNSLGLHYRNDHGGVKYLTYTYIFAEYNPPNGQAPAPVSAESIRSEWFDLDSLPDNLIVFIRDDGAMIDHVLYTEVWPRLLQARGIEPPTIIPLRFPASQQVPDTQQAPAPQQAQVPQQFQVPQQIQAPRIQVTQQVEANQQLMPDAGTSSAPHQQPDIPMSNAGVFFGELPEEDCPVADSNIDIANTGAVQYPVLPSQPHPNFDRGKYIIDTLMANGGQFPPNFDAAFPAYPARVPLQYPILPSQTFSEISDDVTMVDSPVQQQPAPPAQDPPATEAEASKPQNTGESTAVKPKETPASAPFFSRFLNKFWHTPDQPAAAATPADSSKAAADTTGANQASKRKSLGEDEEAAPAAPAAKRPRSSMSTNTPKRYPAPVIAQATPVRRTALPNLNLPPQTPMHQSMPFDPARLPGSANPISKNYRSPKITDEGQE
ncbi:hypothetical protein F4825DRAFT_405494 [Nemania diffusa]|nr:hypothetical protein F4825DRAFT_405494 [Nemania diffusa]